MKWSGIFLTMWTERHSPFVPSAWANGLYPGLVSQTESLLLCGGTHTLPTKKKTARLQPWQGNQSYPTVYNNNLLQNNNCKNILLLLNLLIKQTKCVIHLRTHTVHTVLSKTPFSCSLMISLPRLVLRLSSHPNAEILMFLFTFDNIPVWEHWRYIQNCNLSLRKVV